MFQNDGNFFFQFRVVVPSEEINNYQDLLKDKDVSFERLSEKTNGVFYNENIPLTDDEKKQRLEQFLQEESEEILEGKADWKIGVEALKKLLDTRTNGKVYFRDIEDLPLEDDSLLSSFTSYISIDEGNNMREMPGINIPMYYVGGTLSYTTHHEEDSGLNSLNILRAGSPKIWFIISHKFREESRKSSRREVWHVFA